MHSKIQKIFNTWESGAISDSHLALSFFLHYHLLKYPNKKLQSDFDQDHDIFTLFQKYSFKKVKGKALVSLDNWIKGEWDFKLLDYIPTPYEVLSFQAQGIRPVTLKLQESLTPILNREDCLEFFLHDLEHGYMFFFDDELKEMQIRFFKNVEKSHENKFWDKYLENGDFKEKFYYLISDMNSHQEHYRQYLGSILPVREIEKCSFLFE